MSLRYLINFWAPENYQKTEIFLMISGELIKLYKFA